MKFQQVYCQKNIETTITWNQNFPVKPLIVHAVDEKDSCFSIWNQSRFLCFLFFHCCYHCYFAQLFHITWCSFIGQYRMFHYWQLFLMRLVHLSKLLQTKEHWSCKMCKLLYRYSVLVEYMYMIHVFKSIILLCISSSALLMSRMTTIAKNVAVKYICCNFNLLFLFFQMFKTIYLKLDSILHRLQALLVCYQF